MRNENPQNKEDRLKMKRLKRLLIMTFTLLILRRRLLKVFKPQDKDSQVKARDRVSVDEETKSDESPTIKVVKSVIEGVKEKKKNVSPRTS